MSKSSKRNVVTKNDVDLTGTDTEIKSEITDVKVTDTPIEKEDVDVPQPTDVVSEEESKSEDNSETNDTDTKEDNMDNDNTTIEQPVIGKWSEVRDIIVSQMTLEEKLKALSDVDFHGVNILVAILMDYKEVAKYEKDKTPDYKLIAKYNTKLYNTIMTVLRSNDGAEFKIKFDIINMVVANDNSGAFDEIMLCRFSDLMTLDKNKLSTYHKLCVIISTLANPETRSKKAKSISGINVNFSAFIPEDIVRLKTYYGM